MPATRNLPQVTLTYTPSAAPTKANLADFVERIRVVSPADAAQLEQEFASGDFIDRLGDLMRAAGLEKNNVADAYAAWLISVRSVANRDTSQTSPRMAQSVAAQMADAFAQAPEFAALGDADRQQSAEIFMVQGRC
ncbi:hypothetical protein FNJ84_02490 [Paracoccus sp. M683]|uniref:DUF6683 family protein n=1 Tax=Paracoccus sp. M683 TaxID=2594268 RepID=UPI0011802F91|nr:DUF6683 family protein [Paracoccus sp. M683]TRW99563.1 hypothetical protein FNJ84_02490 [Paracoccus sp. M683]